MTSNSPTSALRVMVLFSPMEPLPIPLMWSVTVTMRALTLDPHIFIKQTLDLRICKQPRPVAGAKGLLVLAHVDILL